jgi:hypothetical protein
MAVTAVLKGKLKADADNVASPLRSTEISMCNQSHEPVETALTIVKDGYRGLLIIQ